MKKLLFLILVLIYLPMYGGSELSELDCGSFRGEFHYYIDLFSGFGGSNDASGQFRENPVLSCDGTWSQAEVGISPHLSMKLSTFDNYIDDEIAAMVGSIGSDTLKIGYPEKNIRVGQIGGIRDLNFQFQSGEAGFWGISFWRPLGLDGSLTANSLQMTMKTDAGLRDEETRIVLGNDIMGELVISLDQSRFAYGRKFASGLKAAIGFDVLHLNVRANAESRTEGFIRQYGGDTDITQAFNNPIDSQYFRNSLDNEWHAVFEEDIMGWNCGISYQVNEEVLLDLGFSQPLRQNISGTSEAVLHEIGAVNYEALMGESDGEIFDELLLEPSKMTYSNEVVYQCESLILNYPGIIRLGMGYEHSKTRQQFIMATYLGELSFRYQGTVWENGRTKTERGFENYESIAQSDYTYGLEVKSKLEYNVQHDFNQKLGIFANMQYFTMGEVLENITEEDGEAVIPEEMINLFTITCGLNYHFTEQLRWDLRLFGFPGTFLDSRIVYRFGGSL